MPPVSAVIPAKVEVAVAPKAVAVSPCEKVEVPVVEVASMVPVWMRSTWRPVARVVVEFREFGTFKMVVEAELAIWKADFPAVCSSQMVNCDDWVPRAVVVPTVIRPSFATEKCM